MGEGEQVRQHHGRLIGKAARTMKLPRRKFLHLGRRCNIRARAGSSCRSARLSDAAGQARARFHARRPSRYPGASGQPAPGRAARPAVRDREPAGRRHHHRHRICRARRARRLHAIVGDVVVCHQRHALRQAQLQFHPRHRAGRQHRFPAAGGRGQSGAAGQNHPGADRLRQGQSRQDQLRHRRGRLVATRGRRAVQLHGRHRPRPCALSRRVARRERCDQRPGADDVQPDPAVDGLHSRRPIACRSR